MSLYENLKGTSPYENRTIELLRNLETARLAVLKEADVCSIYKDGALKVANKIAKFEWKEIEDVDRGDICDRVYDMCNNLIDDMNEWEARPKEKRRWTNETVAAFWTAYNTAAGVILNIARKYLVMAKDSARLDEKEEPKLIGETWEHRSQLANRLGDEEVLEYGYATHDYINFVYVFITIIDGTFPHIFDYQNHTWRDQYYYPYLETGIYAQIQALKAEASEFYNKIRYTAGDY